jgi:hypothetical protein
MRRSLRRGKRKGNGEGELPRIDYVCAIGHKNCSKSNIPREYVSEYAVKRCSAREMIGPQIGIIWTLEPKRISVC